MKSFLLLYLIFFALTANATNYYISVSAGNDANPGISPGLPWKTLSKLNSAFGSFGSGDSILFKRGDTFYGSIAITRRGTPGSPIIIGAYGFGANPVITGFTSIKEWKNIGGNIWESVSEVSTLPSVNMLVANGINTPMGRYPNEGYLTYQSFTRNSITSSSLNSAEANWTGAVEERITG